MPQTPANASRRFSSRSLLLMGAGVFVIVFGSVLGAVLGVALELRARRADSWPAVEAVVVRTDVEADQEDECHRVVVEYAYEVGQQRYTSRRHGFLDAYHCDRWEVDELLARYPPGRRIHCFVDPEDPTSAVLDRSRGQGLAGFIMAGASLLVGLLVIVLGLRERRDDHD